MTLDEQLAMATNAVPVSPAPVAQTQNVGVVQPTQTLGAAQAVQPQVVPVQQTVTQPVQQAPINPVNIPNSSIDLNKAAADAIQHYGIEEIQLGQVVSTRAIDPVKKMDKGEKMRFTILDPTVRVAKIHNHEKLGKIACWSNDDPSRGPVVYGQCCRDMDAPKVRYYMPILVYPTLPNDPKTPITQGKAELRLLIIWDVTSYNKLCEEITEAGSPYIDIIATSEDTYGKLDFKAQRDSFREIPEFKPAVDAALTKWEAVKDKAPLTVRRDMDAERYVKLTQVAVPPQMQTYSQEDILG